MGPAVGCRSETYEVRGVPLHVDEAGEGPPLIFLHGAGAVGAWTPFHDMLAQRHRVLAPHLPGFGSTPDVDWIDSMDELVLFMLDWIDQEGLRGAVLVGSSMGGWLAVELAVHHSESFGAIVLLNAAGLEIPEDPIRDWFGFSPEQQVAAVFGDPSIAAGLFPAEPDEDFILALWREKVSAARICWGHDGTLACNPHLPRRIHRVQNPVLVLWGDRDGLIPPLHGERYRDLLPDARLAVLPGVGHAPFIEAPQAAAQLVLDFLAERSPR